MLSRFREVEQAIAYLCEGVDAWVGKGQAAVTWYPGGAHKPEQALVDVPHLVATLQHYCRKFPGATAVVDVTRADAPLFGLQCRCDAGRRQNCPGHCKTHADRPTVCIVGCRGNETPSEEKRKALLAALQEVVRQQVAEDQERGDLHPRHSPKR